MSLWRGEQEAAGPGDSDGIDPFHFARRQTLTMKLAANCPVGPGFPPRVIVRLGPARLEGPPTAFKSVKPADTPIEGVVISTQSPAELAALQANAAAGALPQMQGFLIVDLGQSIGADELDAFLAGRPDSRHPLVILRRFAGAEAGPLSKMAAIVRSRGCFLACDVAPRDLDALGSALQEIGGERLLFTYSGGHGSPDFGQGTGHALGAYRRIAARLGVLGLSAPVWIRNTAATAVRDDRTSLSNLIEASFLCGALLCDGIGDLVTIEEGLVGGACYDAHQVAITDETMAKAHAADAVIFGAVGGPKWDKVPFEARPEAGLLRLRKDLGLFANIRPAIVYPALAEASSLKREAVEGSILSFCAS